MAAGVVGTVLLLKVGNEGKEAIRDKKTPPKVAEKPAPTVDRDEELRREAKAKAERKAAEEADLARKAKEKADKEKADKQRAEAVAKLLELKAKLSAAQEEAERAKLEAAQARAEADKATEKAAAAERVYSGSRLTQDSLSSRASNQEKIEAYKEVLDTSGTAARAEQAAKASVERAKQAEEKYRQAAKKVDDAAFALRVAEQILR
jgi:hypothetical protein